MTPQQKLAIKEILFEATETKTKWNPEPGELAWFVKLQPVTFTYEVLPCLVLGHTKHNQWHIVFGSKDTPEVQAYTDCVWSTKEAAKKHATAFDL